MLREVSSKPIEHSKWPSHSPLYRDVAEKLAETSWVYRLFGGKFRSRVNCSECNHNSDTFDTLLDLSVDVGRCDTLGEALKKFANVEKLEGKNKYKCEK